MGRELTQSEFMNHRIRCMQLEQDRPARMMCNLANEYIRLFRAYEHVINERKEEDGN